MITLRPPHSEDIPTLAAIWRSAHADEDFGIATWSGVVDDAMREKSQRDEAIAKVTGIAERGTKVLVALQDDEIVGWTSWDIFPCEWQPVSGDWKPPSGFSHELAEERSTWGKANKKRLREEHACLACELQPLRSVALSN